MSICTRIYGLAYAGLLDDRRVSTHWRFASRITREFPKLKVEPDALFVKDGAFYTSAGIAAGIDLSLALIEEDYGPKLALDVARELVVYLKRPGGRLPGHWAEVDDNSFWASAAPANHVVRVSAEELQREAHSKDSPTGY